MVVRELFARLGFQLDESQVRRFDGFIGRAKRRLERFTDTFRSAFARIGAALTVGALGALTRSLITTGDLLAKQAKQLGLTATELRAWQHAAELSGVSTERLNAALNTFFSQIRGASFGSMEAERAFKRLGIATQGIEKRSVDDLLLEVADGFTKLDSATEKAAFATQLFGESGRALIPLLNQGRTGVEKLRNEVFAITGKDGLDRFAKEAEDAADALTRWKLTASILTQELAARFLPLLTDAVQWVTRWVAQNGELLKSLVNVKAIILTLGAVMTAMFAPQIVALGTLAAAFLFVYAVIDDIVRFIEGRPSLLDDFFDIEGLRKSWSLFKDQLKRDIDELARGLEALSPASAWEAFSDEVLKPLHRLRDPASYSDPKHVGRGVVSVQNNTINANGADAQQLFDMLEHERRRQAREVADRFGVKTPDDAAEAADYFRRVKFGDNPLAP